MGVGIVRPESGVYYGPSLGGVSNANRHSSARTEVHRRIVFWERRFSVPKYQRSFSWTADETVELWDDLFGAVAREGEYFLGTVVLQRKSPDAQEIIDGQQRLACITMLFSAIRNVFLSSDDKRAVQIQADFLGSKGYARHATLNPKLALNKINNETFLQYVLESEDSSRIDTYLGKKDLHPSNRLLLEAYKYFLGKVAQEVASRGGEG